MLWSPPGAKGTPRAGVGHGVYPCKLLSGPCDCQGPQSWWVRSSFHQDPFYSCGGQVGSLPFGASPKQSPSCPHHHNISGLNGGGGDNVGGAPSFGPLWGHCWSLGNLSASSGTIGRTSHPLPYPSTHTSCWILQASQLEGSAKMYICKWCKTYLQLGLSGVPLPSRATGGLSSLSLI